MQCHEVPLPLEFNLYSTEQADELVTEQIEKRLAENEQLLPIIEVGLFSNEELQNTDLELGSDQGV